MFEIQSKIKRQVEILGHCLNNTGDKRYSIIDLAEMFNVEKLTIDRDLKELRDYGIDIHSSKKGGVCLDAELSYEKLYECIAHYSSINFPVVISEKATTLLVQKRGSDALKTMITLQHCIENKITAIIVYNKKGDNSEKRMVDPVKIFMNEGSWRLLAKDKGKLKQFLLIKILNCELTNESFPEVPAHEYQRLFEYSFKSWLGEEEHHVVLKLSEKWADYNKCRMFTPHQKIYKNDQGEYIFEAVVNTLREITSWILSMGQGVEVIAPAELRESVIATAENVLSNYQKENITELSLVD